MSEELHIPIPYVVPLGHVGDGTLCQDLLILPDEEDFSYILNFEPHPSGTYYIQSDETVSVIVLYKESEPHGNYKLSGVSECSTGGFATATEQAERMPHFTEEDSEVGIDLLSAMVIMIMSIIFRF